MRASASHGARVSQHQAPAQILRREWPASAHGEIFPPYVKHQRRSHAAQITRGDGDHESPRTEDELVEALLHLMGYLGAPLVREALLTAKDVFADLRAAGS